MPQSSPYARAVVLFLVRFFKINWTTRVFASYPENEAVDDKSLYPGREALPSAGRVKKKKERAHALLLPGRWHADQRARWT